MLRLYQLLNQEWGLGGLQDPDSGELPFRPLGLSNTNVPNILIDRFP
jgi:hypothetical protein